MDERAHRVEALLRQKGYRVDRSTQRVVKGTGPKEIWEVILVDSGADASAGLMLGLGTALSRYRREDRPLHISLVIPDTAAHRQQVNAISQDLWDDLPWLSFTFSPQMLSRRGEEVVSPIPAPPSVPHRDSIRLAQLESLLLRPIPPDERQAAREWTAAAKDMQLTSRGGTGLLMLVRLVRDLRRLEPNRFEKLAAEAARTLDDLSQLTKKARRTYWTELMKRWKLIAPGWVTEPVRQGFLHAAPLFGPKPIKRATNHGRAKRPPTPAQSASMVLPRGSVVPRRRIVRLSTAEVEVAQGLDYESLEDRPPGSIYPIHTRMRQR